MKRKMIIFLATGGYAGKIPFAPGTFGTIAAIPFALAMIFIPSHFLILYAVCLIIGAIFLAEKAEAILGRKDPDCIVIDEIAGYVIAMSAVPVNIYSLAAGFFIFRFFDIVKLPPVRYFEKAFPGGTGIVLDDAAAGLLSAAVLRILYLLGMF